MFVTLVKNWKKIFDIKTNSLWYLYFSLKCSELFLFNTWNALIITDFRYDCIVNTRMQTFKTQYVPVLSCYCTLPYCH